jgi:flavodoxin
MKIEIYHASKFGNGARVAEELRRVLVAKGHQAEVHHIKDAKPKELPPADMYVFGSPTRFGGPLGQARRFIKKARLPPGTKYAIFATHGDAVPDRKTGRMPTEEEIAKYRKTLPILEALLKEKGLVMVADSIFVVIGTTLKGPLKEGWEAKVEEFATAMLKPA